MKFRIIPIETICAINLGFTDRQTATDRVQGCYSSFCYYESMAEKIASVVLSLVKGHFFVDGNKRTALFVYLALSRLNGLMHIDKNGELVELMVELAAGQRSIPEAARLLFPRRGEKYLLRDD